MDARFPAYKHAALPAGAVVGDYRVVKELWAGGFGFVYLALDAAGRKVALKEYLPAMLASRAPGEQVPGILPDKQVTYQLGAGEFSEIGAAVARVSHPAVVGVSEVVRANHTAYLVMDYLQGATLQDFIVLARQRNQPKVFLESTIRSLFDELLPGLQALHEQGVIHLDVKPGNLFVTDDDRIVLIDFGAARAGTHRVLDLPEMPQAVHTPGFAAPEVYRAGSALGAWTDMYAVGACLFSCMRGYPPRDVPRRLKRDLLHESLALLRSVYPDSLVDVVRWCMALDPAARPQSASALRAALDA